MYITPLNANVVHSRHDADVACSACRTGKFIKMVSVFLKEEKNCYKMVYYCLS